MFTKKNFISLIFLFLLSGSLLPASSRCYLSSYYEFKYSQVLGISNELFFEGQYGYGDHLSLYGGFSTAFKQLPERYFLKASLTGFPHFMAYNVTFLGREFIDSGIIESSIYPTVKFITRSVDIEVGMGMRFLAGMPESFTVSTLYNVKFKIFNRKNFKLFYTIKNHDHFYSSNITDLSHNLDSEITLFDSFILLAGIGTENPGQVGFTTIFSSFYANLGLKYSYAD